MHFTIIHISDLHFRSNWPEENDLVCSRLFEDLEVQTKKYKNPYLVFSGDFVLAGANSDFYAKFDAMKLEQRRDLLAAQNYSIEV